LADCRDLADLSKRTAAPGESLNSDNGSLPVW
jgi:hypothetical protein